ncbi:MAG: hypothetical protein AAGU27_00780 [Dehalobacterium sp.]
MEQNLPGIWSIITPLIFFVIIGGGIWRYVHELNTKGTTVESELWQSPEKDMSV